MLKDKDYRLPLKEEINPYSLKETINLGLIFFFSYIYYYYKIIKNIFVAIC